MKQLGGVTYIGVSLKDLNKYFKDDAVIHVSKKFLASYKMITGISWNTKTHINQCRWKNWQDRGEDRGTYRYGGRARLILLFLAPEKDPLPPVELNMSKGDW